MQDHGIAYGFPESASTTMDLEVLSPQIKTFIDKHPTMVHADADMAWLLNEPRSESVKQDFGRNGNGPAARGPSTDAVPRTTSEASHHRTLSPGADLSQFLSVDNSEPSHISGPAHDDTASLADSFTVWLLEMSEGSFELGSLAFFRSSNHKALMNHLQQVNSARLCSPVEKVPAHSLSASILLPKQSVWNFRKMMPRHATLRPSPTVYARYKQEQRHPLSNRGRQYCHVGAMRDQLQF
jgi:mannosyltransferase